MSKKQLKVAAIQSELSESAYFARPTSPTKPAPTRKQPASLPHTASRNNERVIVETEQRTKERTDEPKKEIKPPRSKIRHTFDIYQDQLVSLQVLQLEEFKQGRKKPRLGDMVQEALDRYIKKKEKQA